MTARESQEQIVQDKNGCKKCLIIIIYFKMWIPNSIAPRCDTYEDTEYFITKKLNEKIAGWIYYQESLWNLEQFRMVTEHYL